LVKNNMANIEINSIYGGIQPTLNFGPEGSYLGACAIDPDENVGSRISGTISPVAYTKTTGVSDVMWLEPNDKNNDTYYYTSDGKFGKIDVTGGTTQISALASASGNGLIYHNKYYYIAKDEEILRYGDVGGTPSFDTLEGKVNEFYIGPEDTHITEDAAAQSVEEDNEMKVDGIEVVFSSIMKTVNVTLELRADNSGDPGAVLATGDTISTGNMTAGRAVRFTFDTTQTLNANTKYWITLTFTQKEATRIRTNDDYNYANGTLKYDYNGVWSDANTDLSMTLYHYENVLEELESVTYSTIGNYEIPNHQMFLHSDNRIYYCNNLDGNGFIGKFTTTTGLLVERRIGTSVSSDQDRRYTIGDVITGQTSGATAVIITKEEGHVERLGVVGIFGEFQVGERILGVSTCTGTDSGWLTEVQESGMPLDYDSRALELPKGYHPLTICNHGMDLIISASNGQETRIFFWDTFADSFYKDIRTGYLLIPSMANYNGELYTISGEDNFSLNKYLGGDSFQEIIHCDHGMLPLQGAVKVKSNRILMGSKQTYPETRGCVWAYGTRATMPKGLHNIANTDDQISALTDDILSDDAGLYSKGTTGYDSIWRSEMINFSQPFTIDKLTIPFSGTFGTGADETVVKAILHYDNDRVTDEHTIALEEGSRTFTIHPDQQGTTNFYIEITLEGNTFVSVNLPIRIEYTINE